MDTAEGRLVRQLELRPVPPRPGASRAFAGYSGSILLELTFTPWEEPTVRADLSFTTTMGANARDDAAAAELLYAFWSHTRITMRSNSFFPEAGELAGEFESLRENIELERMGWMRDFYADLAFLEEQLGIELPQPDNTRVEDIQAVGTAATVLRTGEGTATFGQGEGMVQNPLDIPRVPEEFRKQQSVERMVTYTIFGREVQLGMAKYELPSLKVVNIIPYGQSPTSPARVVLEAEGDGQMRFKLLDWEPPVEDGRQLEPSSGSEPSGVSVPEPADEG